MAKRFVILVAMALAMLSRTNAAEPNYKHLEAAGIHNLFSVGTNLFSGSAPEGEAGFAALEKLGIKTIITVDGAKPDVEMAHRHGMHYIHLPHGYDGINTNTQAQLIKAAQVSKGPIFVHCHHGLHRGPAAAAVICMAKDGWSATEAEAWLKSAGTSTNYQGLYRTVRDFKTPSSETLQKLPTTFPESREVSSLVDAMVEVDNAFDSIKPLTKESAELDNQLALLAEHFREAQRLPISIARGNDFLAKLRDAERVTTEARTNFQPRFPAIARQCTSCHSAHRDK